MGESGKRFRGQKDNYGDNKNQKRRTEKEEKGGDELVAYRILCPDTVIGSVIGKAGKVINSIRQETKSKVKVVDPFPGAKDRVLTIYCYLKDKLEIEIDEEYNNKTPLCPSQDALLRMHAAIANAVSTLGDQEKRQKDKEECNILVPASQSANVIGKSGITIKKLRSRTRANIKVIQKDNADPSHSCAMDFDNFVQITGDSESVKKALFAVSAIMYKFPPKEDIPLDTSVPEGAPSIIIPADMPIYPGSGFYTDPMVPPRSAPPLMDVHAPDLPASGYADAGNMWSVVVPGYGGVSRSEELTIRVLCPSDNIGRVIGRGGSTIKSVRQNSGTYIEVDDSKTTKDKCGECVITIKSVESVDDLQSKAVEAVLLLQEKINEDAERDIIIMRLLIPSKNIGCIIGKNGSIINEIRKRTRAEIRISRGEKLKFSDEGDEYVELSGEVKNVRDALIQIVLRLRDDALKDKDGASNPSVGRDPLYAGSSGHSLPPVLHPPVNPLGYEPRNDSGSGVSMLSSGGHYKYGSLPMGDDGYGSSYSSSHYGGMMSSTTLELYIPGNAVGKVLGKNGANLSNIRQLSGAVIEISEPKSSRGDRVAHISGTSEQKRSADNLIQAFIMST